ncbi:MAG: Crp/Fnr family transcriptional regulator [Candidatus Zixiibacteriota bacterium]
MDTQRLLHNCYLCKELNELELEAIASIVLIKNVKKGEIIFFEGDLAVGFYTLLTGLVRVYKSSPEGKEYTLHLIHPGQMFAEAAIFGNEIFPANAIALEDSVTAFFPKESFIHLIGESPQISLKMISALSKFVREFNQQIEDLSLKEVSARLASFLIKKSYEFKDNQITLNVSKTELAHSLGTISETLSRNLKKMRELGLIDVSGKTISILKPDKLKLIADGEKI